MNDLNIEIPVNTQIAELNVELKKYPDLRPRLAFSFPLNENRRNAVRMIEAGNFGTEHTLQLLTGDDFVEKQSGAYLLYKSIEISKETAGNYPLADTIKILRAISKEGNHREKEIAARAIVQLLVANRKETLDKLSKDEDPCIKMAAVNAQSGKSKENPDVSPFNLLNQLRFAHGEKAESVLKQIAESEDGDKNLRYEAQRELTRLIFIRNGQSRLLSTAKPLFGSPDRQGLVSGMKELEELYKILKEEFKEGFTGLTMVGSRFKGYANDNSDFEIGVIAKDARVLEKAHTVAIERNLKFQFEGLEEHRADSQEDLLFTGIFIGNHRELCNLQLKTVKQMNHIKWDRVRRNITRREMELGKAAERFGIGKEEIEQAQILSSLYRVPPPYEQTLEILNHRVGTGDNILTPTLPIAKEPDPQLLDQVYRSAENLDIPQVALDILNFCDKEELNPPADLKLYFEKGAADSKLALAYFNVALYAINTMKQKLVSQRFSIPVSGFEFSTTGRKVDIWQLNAEGGRNGHIGTRDIQIKNDSNLRTITTYRVSNDNPQREVISITASLKDRWTRTVILERYFDENSRQKAILKYDEYL